MSKKRVNLADVLKAKTGKRNPRLDTTPATIFAELKGVEVFVSGTHRGKAYTEQDLQDMETNFKRFSTGESAKLKVPAVIGHEEDQEFLKRTDLPAAGWLTSLGNGTDGVQRADVGDVAKPVAALIASRRYRKVSPEVYDAPPEGVPGNRPAILQELKARGRDALADLEEAKAWASEELPRRVEVWENRKAGYDAGTLDKQPGPKPEYESLVDERLRGHFGKMLRRLSFLGGEIPQIKSLADIPMPTEAYSERPVKLRFADAVEHDGSWACFFEACDKKYADTPEGQALKKYTDEFVKKMCDKGPNAGKPGPCPKKGGYGKAALAGAGVGAGVRGAIGLLGRHVAKRIGRPQNVGVMPSIARSTLTPGSGFLRGSLTPGRIAGSMAGGAVTGALGAMVLRAIKNRKANKNAEQFAEPKKRRFHFGVSPGLKRVGLMAAGAGLYAVGSKTALGKSLLKRTGIKSLAKRQAGRLNRIGSAIKRSAMSYRPGKFAEGKFRKAAKIGAGLALGAAGAYGAAKVGKAGLKFHKAHKTIMRRLPPVFKGGERIKSFAKGAAVAGLAAVLSKTRAARMLGNRSNKMAMKGAKLFNRGHAFVRKTTGFRFAECTKQGKPSGVNALGPGCGDHEKFATLPELTTIAGGISGILGGRRLTKNSKSRVKRIAGVIGGAVGGAVLGHRLGGAAMKRRFAEKFCDVGQNAGKPGPCPKPGSKLKTAGLIAGGALTGAAIASTPLGRRAISGGLKFGKSNFRKLLANKSSIGQLALGAVTSRKAQILGALGTAGAAAIPIGLALARELGVGDVNLKDPSSVLKVEPVQEYLATLRRSNQQTARGLAVRTGRAFRKKLPGAEDKRADGGKFAVGNLGGPGRPKKKKDEPAPGAAFAEVSAKKARKILHDGTVHGKKLTPKQRRFFGAMSRFAEIAKFCATGPNAGKPGPCPEFAGRRVVARATGQAKSLSRIEAAANQPGLAGRAVGAVKGKIAANYARLSARYGPRYAKAIIAATIAGAPIPVPGSMAITAAPVLAVAEGHKRLGGAFGKLAARAVRLAPRMAFKEQITKHCETGINAGKPGPCPKPGGLKRKALIFGAAALAGGAAAYHPTGRKLLTKHVIGGKSTLRQGIRAGVTSRGSLLKQFVGTKGSRLAARSAALKNAQAAVRTAAKSQKVAIGKVSDALGLQAKAVRSASAAEAAARQTSSAKVAKRIKAAAERAARKAQSNVGKATKNIGAAEAGVQVALSKTIAAQRKAQKIAGRVAKLKTSQE